MNELRYTLLSDGSSDRALLPILTWLIRQQLPGCAVRSAWADMRRLRQRPRTMAERILWCIDWYPCNILFVHRDAEREPRAVRVAEVLRARDEARRVEALPPLVCVVPVRMTEAWLLCDEAALRLAAGNPNGRQALTMPRVHELESLPDPKSTLRELWLTASGLSGRRRQQVRVQPRRLAELTDDFSPLRDLAAFQALEADFARVVSQLG